MGWYTADAHMAMMQAVTKRRNWTLNTGRLPWFQGVVVKFFDAVILSVEVNATVAQFQLMQRAQDESPECDDALKKEIEEKDGAGTAQKSVRNQRDLAWNGARRCHAETCAKSTFKRAALLCIQLTSPLPRSPHNFICMSDPSFSHCSI